MVTTLLESYKREQAEMECDLAYLMEEIEDSEIDHAMTMVEASEITESVVGYDTIDPEIQEFMEHIDEMPYDHEAELQRIMETTEGLTFDQMIGIEPITEETEE